MLKAKSLWISRHSSSNSSSPNSSSYHGVFRIIGFKIFGFFFIETIFCRFIVIYEPRGLNEFQGQFVGKISWSRGLVEYFSSYLRRALLERLQMLSVCGGVVVKVLTEKVKQSAVDSFTPSPGRFKRKRSLSSCGRLTSIQKAKPW